MKKISLPLDISFICYCSGSEYDRYESDRDVLICRSCGLVFDYGSYNYRVIEKVVSAIAKINNE